MPCSYQFELCRVPPGMDRIAGVTLASDGGEIQRMTSTVDSIFVHRFGTAGVVLFDRADDLATPVTITVQTGSSTPPLCEAIPADDEFDGHASYNVLRRAERFTLDSAPTRLHRRAAAFYHALDLKTNAEVRRRRPQEKVPDDKLGDTVYERTAARLTSPRKLPDLNAEMMGGADRMLRELLLDHFPDHSSPALAAAAARAHTLFASGELLHIASTDNAYVDVVKRLSNGGPNSAFLFAFPEFALWAIHHTKSGGYWESILPGLISACEAFLLCYGTIEGGRLKPERAATYEGYPYNYLHRDLFDQIVSSYQGKSPEQLDELLTCLIQAAFTDMGVRKRSTVHDLSAPLAADGLARRYEAIPRRLICDTRVLRACS